MECGAKTKSGKPCKAPSMGNGKCRIHGGKSPGGELGNTNAMTHGIYSTALNDEEKEIWGRIDIGCIDDELKMARLQYLRALKADREDLAEKLLGRIASMEKTRFEMEGDVESDALYDELEIIVYEESNTASD